MTSTLPFTYFPVPALTSLSPDTGPLAGGQVVTITGTNFISPAQVFFGANAGVVTNVTPTTITVTTPAGAAVGAVPVSVVTGGGASNSLAYTYVDTPITTSITPTSGPLAGGNAATITGGGFGNSIPAVSVTFGGNAATVTAVTPTSITVTVPAGAAPGAINVTVTTAGGSSGPLAYTYLPSPTMLSLSPTSGPLPGGNVVTITGTNFGNQVPGVTVTFGGNAASVLTRHQRANHRDGRRRAPRRAWST